VKSTAEEAKTLFLLDKKGFLGGFSNRVRAWRLEAERDENPFRKGIPPHFAPCKTADFEVVFHRKICEKIDRKRFKIHFV